MRFLVEVDRQWNVTVTCCDERVDFEYQGAMRVLELGQTRRFPAPKDPTCDVLNDAPEDPHALCRATPEKVQEVYEQVAIRREPSDKAMIVQFGCFLLDSLLGKDAWDSLCEAAKAVGADVIELALAWEADDHELHRMNWELMHDGQQFIVEGVGPVDVTVTRVVTGVDLKVRELDSTPRLLYAIGARVTDPEIRPGAEFIGLLSELEERGWIVNFRILERATPKRLRRAMEEFRPDVVHFICHGEVRDDGEGVLLLPSDDPDQPELTTNDEAQLLELLPSDDPDQPELTPHDAAQLLQLLRVNGKLPQIVVLSACQSGASIRLLGAHETAPLAARFVQRGVPIVVGMAGQVSDLACRLFTTCFGQSLLGGGSLVAATAEARRVSFAAGQSVAESVDWAFPTIFMAYNVDPDFQPVPPEADAVTTLVNGWISSYRVNANPVFCARNDFFEAYWNLFRPGRTSVLAAFVSGNVSGLGRTRLLQELTKDALRDGHLPLLIAADRPEESPRTLPDFCKEIAAAIARVRAWLGLQPDLAIQLHLIRRYDPANPSDRLDEQIRALLEIADELTPDVVELAIRMDLGRLVADARARHEHIARGPGARGPGRAILLLDEVDDNSVALVQVLHDRLLGDYGLGTQAEPIPVVFAFERSNQDNILRQIAEQRSDKPWLMVKELRPFQSNGEDLLAYENVMLHPFNHEYRRGLSDLPWVFNREVRDRYESVWNEYIGTVRFELQGKPSIFYDRAFYAFINYARMNNPPIVKEADDRALLRKHRPARVSP